MDESFLRLAVLMISHDSVMDGKARGGGWWTFSGSHCRWVRDHFEYLGWGVEEK